MPNLDNAKKALRQSLVRAERNAKTKATISYLRRSFRKLLEDKQIAEATKVFHDLGKALDKAVGKNVLKLNNAARVKSRAALKLNASKK